MPSSFLAFALVAAISSARAGQEKGNGGDGVVTTEGEVLLFDFFEWSSVVNVGTYVPPIVERARVAALEARLREVVEAHGPEFLSDKVAGGGESRQMLASVLSLVSDRAPDFALEILGQLEKFTWVRAGETLPPNPDTKPVLDVSRYSRRIGCARNEGGVIRYSPECGDERMRPMSRAGLALHEALYGLYRRTHPDEEDSFEIRVATQTLFSADARQYFPIFEDFLGPFTEDKTTALRERFFGGTTGDNGLRMVLDCFPDVSRSGSRRVTLVFNGAFRVKGAFDAMAIDRAAPVPIDGTLETAGAWTTSLPRYDLARGSINLDLGPPAEPSRWNVEMTFGDGHEASLRMRSRAGAEIGGRCYRR